MANASGSRVMGAIDNVSVGAFVGLLQEKRMLYMTGELYSWLCESWLKASVAG